METTIQGLQFRVNKCNPEQGEGARLAAVRAVVSVKFPARMEGWCHELWLKFCTSVHIVAHQLGLGFTCWSCFGDPLCCCFLDCDLQRLRCSLF